MIFGCFDGILFQFYPHLTDLPSHRTENVLKIRGKTQVVMEQNNKQRKKAVLSLQKKMQVYSMICLNPKWWASIG
jgi:hypothetical protein